MPVEYWIAFLHMLQDTICETALLFKVVVNYFVFFSTSREPITLSHEDTETYIIFKKKRKEEKCHQLEKLGSFINLSKWQNRKVYMTPILQPMALDLPISTNSSLLPSPLDSFR